MRARKSITLPASAVVVTHPGHPQTPRQATFEVSPSDSSGSPQDAEEEVFDVEIQDVSIVDAASQDAQDESSNEDDDETRRI